VRDIIPIRIMLAMKQPILEVPIKIQLELDQVIRHNGAQLDLVMAMGRGLLYVDMMIIRNSPFITY